MTCSRSARPTSTRFEVGENLAVTPGKVVYQNDILQLIQYLPTTKKVHSLPLLIVPPWINKFYILDLKPEKSFIKYVVDQGFTVFVVSWVNPDEELAGKTFEDYMREGILEAARHRGQGGRCQACQCARLLRRRHAAGHDPGLAGGGNERGRLTRRRF